MYFSLRYASCAGFLFFLCGTDPKNGIWSAVSQDWAEKPCKSYRCNNPLPGRFSYKACRQHESCKYPIYSSEQEIKTSYIFFQKQFSEIRRTKPPYKPSYIPMILQYIALFCLDSIAFHYIHLLIYWIIQVESSWKIRKSRKIKNIYKRWEGF